ncbi:MAG: hypothetical protein M1821_002903 [Bathelium mastoideum]|nr:MAG: hypothetical protein M1821_002903 [Bathelium mastoideum]KAI9694454.1 MAG: hypothetical protein M1822_000070 [Bathelium mastoideum]
MGTEVESSWPVPTQCSHWMVGPPPPSSHPRIKLNNVHYIVFQPLISLQLPRLMYLWHLLFVWWISAALGFYDDPSDTTWARSPDLTYSELIAQGFEIPEPASPVTEIRRGTSYIVKLDCRGCPFYQLDYLRNYHYEHPGRPNSLLLNFTLAANQLSLLLNGRRVFPLQEQTSHIRAYQVQANASNELLGKIGESRMLDETFRMGTRFGIYRLSFDETLQSAQGSRRTHLSFDIVGITYWHQSVRQDVLLDAPEQQIIRVVLEREKFRPRFLIKDIQLPERCEARSKNAGLPCHNIRSSLLHSSRGRNRISFRDWEWDLYGKIGTFGHAWSFLWRTADDHPFLSMVCFVLVVAGIRKLVAQAHKRGLKYHRHSSGDLEAFQIDGMERRRLNMHVSRMKKTAASSSITTRSKI